VITSLLFFFVSVFLVDMYVLCTKRWRSLAAKMIYLPWKFIHLRCLLWRLSCIYSERVYLSIVFRHEEKKNNKNKEVWIISFYFSNFIDRWKALFSFFAYLFIRHIQPRHWHVIPCWRFSCVVLLFFFLHMCRIPTEMIMCCCCDDRGGVTIFVHLCMSSNEMRRARGYKRKC